MPDDSLTELAKRIEEQTQEIRRLRSTVIWTVGIGVGAVVLALLVPQVFCALLAVGAVFASIAGIALWGSNMIEPRIRGARVIAVGLIMAMVVLVIVILFR